MDDLRPRLHLTAPHGWINDPHGITWHGGLYHAFFQTVPGADAWAPGISWGHATSADLATWEHLPPALVPGEGDDGVWSGGLVRRDDGGATIFYTGVRSPDLDTGRIRTAVPLDADWVRWRKEPGTVLPHPPETAYAAFRDPVVVPEGDGWRLLVGVGTADGVPQVLSWTSPDLRDWTPRGVLAEPAPGAGFLGPGWECPSLARIGGSAVLLVSRWDQGVDGVYAGLGALDGHRLRVERWQRVAAGPGHFAAQLFVDAEGRPALMSWIRGVGGGGEPWVGALSIPYRVGLDGGRLELRPHPLVRAGARSAGVLAVDWVPGPDDLVVTGDAGEVARLSREPDGTIAVRTAAAVVPGVEVGRGPVAVLVDGGVLEVATGPSLVGLPVDGRGVRVVAGDATLW